MRVLLDTHYLIWSFVDTSEIKPKILDRLLAEENEVFYSQASPWEIPIKYNSRKLAIEGKNPEILYEEIKDSHYVCRKIKNEELISF